MAPFADAVSFVNCNSNKLPLSMDSLERPSKCLRLT